MNCSSRTVLLILRGDETEAIITAEGTGRGNQVKLVDFDVTAQLLREHAEGEGNGFIERGQRMKVKVLKIDSKSKHCLVARA